MKTEEQNKYTIADYQRGFSDGYKAARPSGGDRVRLDVSYFEEGSEPFIYGVDGRITIDQLKIIEEDLSSGEYSDKFEQGFGDYLIFATHQPEQWDFIGGIVQVAFAAHWKPPFRRSS